jgi:hypothetical protein
MGRIGNFFKRVGRGIKKGAGFFAQNILRPISYVASNPITEALINAIKPGVGPAVQGVGGVVKGIVNRDGKEVLNSIIQTAMPGYTHP